MVTSGGRPWGMCPVSGKVVKLRDPKGAWESLTKNWGVGCIICLKTELGFASWMMPWLIKATN